MTTTPDSFNLDELNAMLADAPKEEECHAENDTDKFSEEFIQATVGEALDLMTDRVSDPVVHKVAMLAIASRMIEWHTGIGQRVIGEYEDMGTSWLRDAGKFQAIIQILKGISLGDNDHWCEQE